jgi:hypothetical protein
MVPPPRDYVTLAYSTIDDVTTLTWPKCVTYVRLTSPCCLSVHYPQSWSGGLWLLGSVFAWWSSAINLDAYSKTVEVAVSFEYGCLSLCPYTVKYTRFQSQNLASLPASFPLSLSVWNVAQACLPREQSREMINIFRLVSGQYVVSPHSHITHHLCLCARGIQYKGYSMEGVFNIREQFMLFMLFNVKAKIDNIGLCVLYTVHSETIQTPSPFPHFVTLQPYSKNVSLFFSHQSTHYFP